MRISGVRPALGVAVTAFAVVAALSGCTSGDKNDQGGGPTTPAATASASGQPSGPPGGDAAIAKRTAAELPGGFPDACLLITTADIEKAVRLTQEPQGDTIGQGDQAISVCSYSDGAGTTLIIRTGLAGNYQPEISAGDKITNASNVALAGVGDAARISIGETAPGLEMAVITVRKGEHYLQVIAAVDGANHDQLSTVTSQLAELAVSRL